MKTYNLCIIGGGAAGLCAAASLSNNIKICLLEKNNILGRKITATGGGRCNITNSACESKDIALNFFAEIGLETYCDEEGRYYPYSNQASDVVKLLEIKLGEKDADIITGFEAAGVSNNDGLFIVSDKDGRKIAAHNLLIATGGKASPQFGTTGDGYFFAKSLGHTVNKIYPILTGIDCGSFADIRGVRAKGTVNLYKDGELIAAETGEIQFNEDGISGICVMNMTLHIRSEKGENINDALKRYSLVLDLAPDFTKEQICSRESSFGILSEKLSKRVSIDEIKEWKLPVLGVKGWKNAQCTGGGVSIDEINMDTMESKLVRNLYFAGEILDVQGPCGGYNLQNSWETGIKAAQALSQKIGMNK